MLSRVYVCDGIPGEHTGHAAVAAGTLLSIFISPMSATGVEDEKSSCNSIFAVSFVIKSINILIGHIHVEICTIIDQHKFVGTGKLSQKQSQCQRERYKAGTGFQDSAEAYPLEALTAENKRQQHRINYNKVNVRF